MNALLDNIKRFIRLCVNIFECRVNVIIFEIGVAMLLPRSTPKRCRSNAIPSHLYRHGVASRKRKSRLWSYYRTLSCSCCLVHGGVKIRNLVGWIIKKNKIN